MSTEEEIQKNIESMAAIQDYLQKRTCVIFTKIDGKVDALGSGTILKIGEKYFVSTAAHVINQSNPSQIRIGSELVNNQYFKITDYRYIGGGEEEKEDLAWFEVEPPNDGQLTNIIFDSEFHTETKYYEDVYLISGYPECLIPARTSQNPHTLQIAHFFYQTRLVDPEKWTREFDKDYNLLLEYKKEMVLPDNSLTRIPYAKGISGGGIWYYDQNTRKIRLTGIQIGWDGENEIIYGIQIKHWLQYLHATKPEEKNGQY